MKPYTPATGKGRTVGGHNVHNKTADQPKHATTAAAKSMRHAARQQGKKQAHAGGQAS